MTVSVAACATVTRHFRLDDALEDARRKPMTPAQMDRIYWKAKDSRPGPKSRIMSAVGEALIILRKRLRPESSGPQPTAQFIEEEAM